MKSFVSHYGKENRGFLNYQEFREIYLNHIHYVDNDPTKGFHEDAKLKALFGLFDSKSIGRISEKDFEETILSNSVVTIIERLRNKIKKGGDRLISVLTEEFQEAEIPYGCNGIVPLSNFQFIMRDYDIPMVGSDLKDLKEKALIHLD